MSGPQDAVTRHLAELATALRGPAAPRRSMLAETRDGLDDAAAAHRARGLPPDQAAERAVRDFGPVATIAPLYQEELTARQGRRTAALLAVAFPGLLLGWNLLWSHGVAWTGPAPAAVRTLALAQDVMSVAVAVVALGLLGATFLRAVPARWVTAAIGVTGAVGAAVCGGTAVVMNVAGGAATVDLVARNPAAPVAYAVSAAALVAVAWSVVRTVRLVRQP